MAQRTGTRSETWRNNAMNAFGSVIYAARLEDGVIKIGWTERFGSRLRWLKSYNGQGIELLAFRQGVRDDEKAIHALLAEHVHHGREYYRPTAEVLEVVNGMRTDLNLPHIAA